MLTPANTRFHTPASGKGEEKKALKNDSEEGRNNIERPRDRDFFIAIGKWHIAYTTPSGRLIS
ncbi:hypothetical protein [Beijerinckia mobilis]|uniref:hypothetical protein n=1 Tax=Beijerinckia mobilis TaxID=231434 RepID=UPI0014702878|nr:hypothetical protein [Beijerinckia mobilis]